MLTERCVQAVRTKDIQQLLSCYAPSPDLVFFGLAPPLKMQGPAPYRKNAEEWFASFEGPIGYELKDLTIGAGPEVAFGHSLNHVTGLKKDGNKVDMWFRMTVCFKRIDGRWMVVHEHVSEPFDMKTFEAKLDLKP